MDESAHFVIPSLSLENSKVKDVFDEAHFTPQGPTVGSGPQSDLLSGLLSDSQGGPMVQGGEGDDRISVNIKNLWLPNSSTDVQDALANGGSEENSLSLNVGKVHYYNTSKVAQPHNLERMV